mgnify:CR=1 FL=1
MRYNFLLLAIIVLSACGAKKQSVAKEPEKEADVVTLTDEQIRNAGVETGLVEKRTLNSELTVNGQVDVPPKGLVSVSFALGGYLKHTRLMPGMHVRKGEVIGIMEDPALVQLQQDYLIAVSKLEYLQKDFERQKILNQNKVNADKVYQRVQSEFQEQKVLVKGYSEKLRLIHIDPSRLNENTITRTVPVYSPIDGYVSRVNVNIGKYVSPTDVLFELINPDDLHAALTVFEKDISKIRVGQTVTISFVEKPDEKHDAEVILITKNVDNDRSALVHCHFKKKPGQVLPGMFLVGKIKVDEIPVLAVPEEAVVRYGSGEFVLSVEGRNKYRLSPVQTGVRNASWVELSSGSENLEGREVIVKNPFPVLSALKNSGEE